MERKASGGRYKKVKKRKLYAKKNQPRIVKLGEKKTKLMKVRGGNKKIVSLQQKEINLTINGKSKKTLIKNVIQTPSNVFLARQNVLVKGAIVDTELGKAKITNRPSQEGIVQGILVEDN